MDFATQNYNVYKNTYILLQREMRMYADNGGVQQNQLLIPNLPRSNREAQCQTHPAQSVYTDISANNSAEEFNGNFTSIDTEVVRLLSIDIFLRDIFWAAFE